MNKKSCFAAVFLVLTAVLCVSCGKPQDKLIGKRISHDTKGYVDGNLINYSQELSLGNDGEFDIVITWGNETITWYWEGYYTISDEYIFLDPQDFWVLDDQGVFLESGFDSDEIEGFIDYVRGAYFYRIENKHVYFFTDKSSLADEENDGDMIDCLGVKFSDFCIES